MPFNLITKLRPGDAFDHKKKKNCLRANFAVSAYYKVKMKVNVKTGILGSCRRAEKAIGHEGDTNRTVPKNFERRLGQLEIRGRIETI